MDDHRHRFLSQVPPFDLLPEADLHRVAVSLRQSHHLRDMTLFVQGKTRLNYLYLVFQGRLEQFIIEDGTETMRGFLQTGDHYGGLSLLFNKGVSIRTVRTLEDSTLLRLPRDIFLGLCEQQAEFIQFFIDRFGQRMRQQPYVSVIAQSLRSEIDGFAGGSLNRSLADVPTRPPLTCSQDLSVREVAQLMTRHKRSAVVVTSNTGQSLGLITDHDMREKVVARGLSSDQAVGQVVSSPLITVPAETQVFEAAYAMMANSIKHLAVTDESGGLLSILTEQDLLLAQGHSPVLFMHEIQEAGSVDDLAHRQAQLPGLIQGLMEAGARSEHLNRFITAISDAVLDKVARFALDELGPPPVAFAFLVLGSEGRKEQTLKTDQDNAIVFQDPGDDLQFDQAQAYFLEMGRRVCGWLDTIGYQVCEFEIMAQNPAWCQPLSAWKQYFATWIHAADPEMLLHSSIFFDFRLGFGDQALVSELRTSLFRSLTGWKGFFRHLAENALHFKPPLDFFGNLALQTRGQHKGLLDIKTPMRLMVDFARIYALKLQVEATNTLERLKEMALQQILDREDSEDLIHAYDYLMQTRLSHQLRNIMDRRIPPDNHISPKELTQIEQQALKESLKRIRMAQGKMRMELTSDIGIG